MRRLILILVVVPLALAGCTRETAKPAAEPPVAQLEQQPAVTGKTDFGEEPQPRPVVIDPAKPLPTPVANAKQEQYDAALNDALGLMAQQQLTDALAALEQARGLDDNDFIRGEIAKLKQRLDQQNAAKATTDNIATVLDDGKAADAARLSTDALKEYGGSSAAPALIKLRLQADALQAVQTNEEAAARADRCRAEGEAALSEKNLRAAALAFEQAILARPDAALQQKLDAVQADLQNYDALRARAAELRRDPRQLEDALAALQAAQQAWDTLQVRQELDEYTLALQKRRDTLSVAEFEVRGNLGTPELGQGLADELLPRFKGRYDLVERGQVGKVLAELQPEQASPTDTTGQYEAAKLAKVRYLVVGSVDSLAGITVRARLVDVQTGLVVQTAKVVAPTIAQALALAPDLAQQLLMSDEQKLALEQAQQQTAQAAPILDPNAPLPPPPQAEAQPAAVAVLQVALPRLGGLRLDVFRALPAAPAAGVIVLPPPEPIADAAFRQRLLLAAVQRGDAFFVAGNFAEAQRQFQFALNLAPGNPDLLIRLDRCRPFIAPVVVVAAPAFRPRVAILPFLVSGNPFVVPPGLSGWTPQQLTPYVAERYDVVDPMLVSWYMGSLGMTVNDVMTDPAARRWLGRALGIRYFLLGTAVETASFDVSTYLVDAEFGYLQGTAAVHVRNPFELNLRLGELAYLTLLDPVERQRLLEQAQGFDALVAQAQAAMQQQAFAAAVRLFDDALRLRPLALDVRFYRHRANRLAEAQALERQRQQFVLAQAAVAAEAQRRQAILALAAEQAGLRAVQLAAVLGADERLARQQQRAQAQSLLIRQAQRSFQGNRFGIAVSIYESAVAIAPPPAGNPWRELAQARVEAQRQTQLVQTQLAAPREATVRQAREQELAAAQARIEQQQKQLDAQRQVQAQRDKQAYARALKEGQDLLSKGNNEAATAALLVAKQLQRTPLVDNLLELAGERRAVAQGKTEAERKQLEARLEVERARRIQAEAEAKRNQDRYLQAVQLAQAALQKKDYDAAQAKFTEAAGVFKTDAVNAGLRQIAQARAQETSALKAKQADADKAARVKQLIVQGQAALDKKQYGAAVQTFQQARQLAPNHVDVVAGLSQAEHGRDQATAAERKQPDKTPAPSRFQQLLKSAQANLAAKQYDAAIASLNEALKLNPGDATATAALKQAEQARAAVLADANRVRDQEAARLKLEQQRKTQLAALLKDGNAKLTAKLYPDAKGAFQEALKLYPTDPGAQLGLRQATQAIDAAKLKPPPLKDKTAPPVKDTKALYQKALQDGAALEKQQKYADAVKSYEDALKLQPSDTQASAGLRRAQLNRHVADGQRFLDAGQFVNAQREFEAALKLAPGNPAVTKLLEKAKQMKK